MCTGITNSLSCLIVESSVPTTAKGYTLIQEAICQGNYEELVFQTSLLDHVAKLQQLNAPCKLSAIERGVKLSEEDHLFLGCTPVEMVVLKLINDPTFSRENALRFLTFLIAEGANGSACHEGSRVIEQLASEGFAEVKEYLSSVVR